VKRILAALLLLAVTGCSPSTVDSPPHSRGVCLPPSSATASADASPGRVPDASPNRVPDVELECFEGGGTVRLTELHRPAIVNLWASWCAPCRTELPAFQAYATRAGDRVAVIGVDTGDTRDAGGALLSDLRVTYPTLFDDQQRLLRSIGRVALPVTLFIDAGGGVRYLYNSTPLDEAAIARLASTYLGVAG
jgi:thiol-disulfide isomerase/thioredoxin